AAATRTEAALAAAQGEAAAARAHGEALEREAQALRDRLHQREAEHARALAGTESEARARCAALEGQLAEALQGSASLARLNQSLEASLRRMAQALQERAEPGEAREAPPAEAAPVVIARGSVLRDAAAFARYALRRGPLAAARLIAQARVVRASGLFDAAYYLSRYRDVAAAGADPALHYVAHGAAEGRDPSAAFSTRAYLQRYPDVQAGGRNPLFHYVRHGRSEGRSAAPLRSDKTHSSRAIFGERAAAPIGSLPSPQSPFAELQKTAGAVSAAELEGIKPIPPRLPEPAAPALGPMLVMPRWRQVENDVPHANRYDVRPDDSVRPEAERGEAFFARFGLLSDRPDFSGAVAAINAVPRALRLADPHETPDASIIVPVYGQLGYTLNCLDSLLAHESVFSAEIIIVDDCSPDQSGRYLPDVKGVVYQRQAQNGGFILSCNTGAAKARGRHVVFLNNDTRVVRGWLDELIGAFGILPNAGLVGSKLFYPDGSLQEAGGIIWQDGSSWNYGRNDDPGRPEYCYARQVDYVSGAAIALPADLWRSLGGFDELYRPAYCEDSDLALRVRHVSGKGVWLQPLSRVIHYEGKTSGTDVTKGVKAYQVTNAQKLKARWRQVLAQHRPNGQAPDLEKDRGVEKRALMIDATTPTPDQDAGSVTAVLTTRLYQQLGYKLTFAPEDNFLFLPPYTPDLQRTGVECAYVPFDFPLETLLKKIGPTLDIVQVYRMETAERSIPLVRKHAPQASILFHLHDLHFRRLQREAEVSGDAAALRQALKLRERELAITSAADCAIVHSPVERDFLQQEIPGLTSVVWPYMTDLFDRGPAFSQRRDFIFLGGYGHPPNVDSVIYFVQDIWPKLRTMVPGARFHIVGANAPAEVWALAGSDVLVHGRIDELKPAFDAARVFVAPIRYGAGVKGKVATSMAHGLPVVGTAIALEGMGYRDGEHVLQADTPEDFARASARLYTDEALWNRLSAAGHEIVAQYNSLETGRRVLEEAIASAQRARRRR
ncbi:MAG: glycosyltransferase, partial [Hydrogenophilaceae bacterium]|nr:glycosyltransferase [Hydrogenophilaceae bacterium]